MNPEQINRVMDLRGTYKGGGGPDKTILLSAEKHDKKDFFILVTYLRDPNDSEFQISKKAGLLNISYTDVPDRSLIDWKCLFELNRLIRTNHLNLVHTHDDKSSLYAFFLRVFNPGIKVIYTCHSNFRYGTDHAGGVTSLLKGKTRLLIRFLLIICSNRPIIAVSDAVKQTLISHGISSKAIHTLHNGIDTNAWQRENGRPVLRRLFKENPETQIVGTVARIAAEKDFVTFFRVGERVKSMLPHVEFMVVGDGNGNELEDTKKLARKMGVADFIHFTGHRNDLLDVYRSFDLFLMTSLTEGLPNTVLEAMAMELPVVSTAVDGVPEVVVDGETGFLCQVRDVDCLSNRIIRLLKNQDGITRRFGINGRNRILKRFDFDKRVRAMEAIYKGVISGKA